jgi:hypothetical protein
VPEEEMMTKQSLIPDTELNEIANSIKAGIRHFKNLNECGDYSQVMTWVIPEKLACAARPLRYHHLYGGSGRTLPAAARPELDKWIERVKNEGIVSMVCFVSDKELLHYSPLLPKGVNLIDYYRSVGFQVCHMPWSDPAHSGYDSFHMEVEKKRPILLDAYDQLPKPVLVHCSAAIDRSPPVVAYVVLKRSQLGHHMGA